MDTLMKTFDDWAIDQGMCIEKWQHPAEGYPYKDYDTQKAFEGFRAGWNKRTSEWVSVSERVPQHSRQLIAMSHDSDRVKLFNFGCNYAMLDKSWEVGVRRAFEDAGVTNWMYSEHIQPPKGDE